MTLSRYLLSNCPVYLALIKHNSIKHKFSSDEFTGFHAAGNNGPRSEEDKFLQEAAKM